jgi:predicted dehydrogenase
MAEDLIRLGVFGVGRGLSYARAAGGLGMRVVALCDSREAAVKDAATEFGATAYTQFDDFLSHDMDAVVIANFFHQHAPFAIRALEAGRHVLSECIACKTPAEGVALARAVERTGRIYLFAENYPFFAYNQEMRRLYLAGEVGEVQYAEGEYIHPFSSELSNQLAPGLDHWRNNMPATYYCTHALGPVIYITERRPVSVNALCIPFLDSDRENLHVRRNDPASVILCRLDNGAVARLAGIHLRGLGAWVRIHGTRGQMENVRAGHWSEWNALHVRHEPWDLREGEAEDRTYTPDFPPEHAAMAKQAAHGGGDYFTSLHFAQAIRTGRQPFFDVYRGLDMSLVGIQAYRSALADGAPFEVPDFRIEDVRCRYENDHWSPFPEDRAPGQPLPSIRGGITPSHEAVDYARRVWKEMGREDAARG